MKLRHILLSVAVILAASCERADIISPESSNGLTTITATIDHERDTKVGFTDGAAEFFWTKGDIITYVEDGSTWTLSNDCVGQVKGQFSGTGAPSEGKHFAYGASAISYDAEGNITFTLPDTYGGEGTALALDATYADPYGNSHNMPMLATVGADPNDLSFRLLAGVIAFELKGLNENTAYTLTVDAGGSKINGNFCIDPSAPEINNAVSTDIINSQTPTKVFFSTKAAQTSGYVYIPMPIGNNYNITATVKDESSTIITRSWTGININRRVIKRATLANNVVNNPENITEKTQDAIIDVDSFVSHATLTIPDDYTGSVITFVLNSVSESDNLTIQGGDYSGDVVVAISGSNQTLGTLNTLVPKGDVIIKGGTVNNLTSSAKDNTTTIDASASVGTLTIKKGNVVVAGEITKNIVKHEENTAEEVKVTITESGEIPDSVENNDSDAITVNTPDLAYICANGGTYTLTGDLNLSEILVISGSNVVIDGAEHTLTSSATRAINITNGPVTIKNLKIDSSGERAINVITKPSNVTLDNVTATASNYTVHISTSAGAANVKITGSTITGKNTVNVAAPGAAVKIDSSTINCDDDNTTTGEKYAALCLTKEAVGGSIIATNSTINVTEGSDSEKGRNGADSGVVSINGSTEDVSVMVAAITYPDNNYYYSFSTLAEAVEFAENGNTISLIRNIELSETLEIPSDKTITLDLNGKTVSQEKECTAGYSMITNNGNLTINDSATSGKISFTDTGEGDAEARWGSYTIINNGALHLEKGTIENLSAQNIDGKDFAHCVLAIQQNNDNAVTTIKGGTISTPHYRSVRINKGSLNIEGGIFDGQIWMQPFNTNSSITISAGDFSPNWNDGSSVYIETTVDKQQRDVAVSISGGMFHTKIGCRDSSLACVKGKITGGTFTESAKTNTDSNLIAEGYEFEKSGENWVLKQKAASN